MFERFTADARSAVIGAQVVADQLRSDSIDSRHLLVALLDGGAVVDPLRSVGLDPETVAAHARAAIAAGDVLDAEALASVGVDIEAVRERAEATFGRGALDRGLHRRKRRRHHWPFTSDAKKALELSLREAIRLGDRHIDGAHLLLGILRAECPAGRVLQPALHDAGTDVPGLRTAVEQHRRAA
jgi:ATP-dependent Clp protease ATP-binding subunit ClpA